MKICLGLVFFLISFCSHGQTRVLSGKIIGSEFRDKNDTSEVEFWDLNEARIWSNDSLLGYSDSHGEFRVELLSGDNNIAIGWIGMYPEKFELSDTCRYVEIILLPDARYDFVSYRKEQKLRAKDRAILPFLYEQAYAQNIFKRKEPCR